MDTSKIIKGVVNSGRYTVTAPIVKEDYGLYLKIEGVELPSTYEVDFSNSENSGTSVTMIGNADGVLIPSQFISTGKDVFAFLYHVGEDFGRTVYKFRIPNKVRPDRTNEEPTPEEQSVIDQVIASLNDAVDRAEDAEQAIEDMSVSATTLAEGSSATVTKTESEGVVHLEFGIPRGATGAQGERGEKGDKGDTGAQGIQGIQGERGLQGAKGDKGDKGDTGDTGATGAQGIQGVKGDTGADGYSPTVTITPITGGHRITITDADGEHSADVMDGQTPTVPVEDVQINGTSIVENGVANVPIASPNALGTVKVGREGGIFGIRMVGLPGYEGEICVNKADVSTSKAGRSEYKPITPSSQHAAAFYGLAKAAGDTTQSSSNNAVGNYTEEAKDKIQTMLGVSPLIAPHESDPFESTHVVGELFIINGKLYRAKTVLTAGEYINEGTNVEVVDTSDVYVKNTDIAGDNYGLVKLKNGDHGLGKTSSGFLRVYQASIDDIKTGAQVYRPIVPNHQHEAIFYGLAKAAGDTTQSSSNNAVGNYTDTAKDKIQTMLGIADLIGNSEGTTASKAYSVGDVLLHDGKLYKVTASIAQGSAIVPNTNCTQTTIIDLLRGV